MIGSMQLGSMMMNYYGYSEQKVSGRRQVNSFSGVYESESAASAISLAKYYILFTIQY